MVDLSGGTTTGMVDRIKAILGKPKETFAALAAEPATPRDLIMRWAVPLAAIGPAATFIGSQIFGHSAFGITYRPNLMTGLMTAIVGYVLSLVMIAAMALIAEWFAPKFNGTPDRPNAFKLAVYGATAAWVGGAFGLIPALGLIGMLFGLYSLYLFYLGARPFLKVPDDKALGFTGAIVVSAIVLSLIAAPITAGVVGLLGYGANADAMSDDGEISGSLTVPGVGSIDADKIQQTADRMEAASKGEAKPVSGAQLSALLPASLGAFARASTESSSVGGLSTAEATYRSGDKRIDVKIADMNAMGAIAGIGAAMGVESNREDADGYERTGTVDGQLQTEEWNRTRSRGKFGRMVADRFMVEAQGDAGSIDELKAAVAAVDAARLAALAN